jgi:hypothetical protein
MYLSPVKKMKNQGAAEWENPGECVEVLLTVFTVLFLT